MTCNHGIRATRACVRYRDAAMTDMTLTYLNGDEPRTARLVLRCPDTQTDALLKFLLDAIERAGVTGSICTDCMIQEVLK